MKIYQHYTVSFLAYFNFVSKFKINWYYIFLQFHPNLIQNLKFTSVLVAIVFIILSFTIIIIVTNSFNIYEVGIHHLLTLLKCNTTLVVSFTLVDFVALTIVQ